MLGLWRRDKFSILISTAFLLAGLTPISPAVATSPTSFVTCLNLGSKVERISKTGSCIDLIEAPVKWRAISSAGELSKDVEYKTITVCSNGKNSKYTYSVIRPKCAKYQETASFIRTVAKPTQPVIGASLADKDSQVTLKLEDSPNINLDAPIAFYTITLSDGTSRRVSSKSNLSLAIKGLQENTSYSFTVSATSADGTSMVSVATAPVKTPVRVVEYAPRTQVIAPTLPAAPGISLSAASEIVTVNTGANGFSVNSTGGAVASYSISPAAPAGMTFNTSNGSFSGTPTSTATATTFTVTATNTGGSASATFVLTVNALPPSDSAISVAAIGGVTAPVTGATPVTSVTSANGYTGTVSWSGSPVTFSAVTAYTATITLTAAAGYTLTGVTANFFTVSGASSVSHLADSGVVTAVFPATGAGVATKAMMTTQPSGAVNGVSFTTQPVVRITDANGNTNTSYTGNVVVSKTTGTGTLSGTLTVAAVAGVATFTNLSIIGTVGNFTLTFTPSSSPTSLTSVVSSSFSLTVGAPTKVTFNRTAPTSTLANSAFTIQPIAAIKDSGNNTVTASTAVITATVSAGGTLIGTSTSTAVSGVATFTNLGVDGAGGTTQTITYTADGLTPATATAYLSRNCDGISFNCAIGDIGPGGGKIFHVNLSGFLCGPTRIATCHYLEAAPRGWFAATDPGRTWAQSSPIKYDTATVNNSSSPETATASAIGWGYRNTLAIINQGNTDSATSAAALANDYSVNVGGNTIDDWFLPTYSEVIALVSNGQISDLAAGTFWSSTEANATTASNYALRSDWTTAPGSNSKANGAPLVHPVRSF